VFVLLTHAIDIISHKVDRLAEGVGAPAENLNGLSHELNVTFSEAFISTIVHLVWGCLGLCETAFSLGISSLSLRATSLRSLLFLSNSAHFDLGTSVFVCSRLVIIIIALVHHGLGFLHELTLAFILELVNGLLELFLIIIVLLGWLVVIDVAITDELLVTLLFVHSLLLLLHLAHLGGLGVSLPLPLVLFLFDTLLLLFFASALGILLFLAACFLFSALSLFFSLGCGGLLLGSLGFHLLPHGLLVLLGLGLGSTVVGGSASTQDLLHVGSCIDTCSRGSKQGLQEKVCLLGFVTSDDFGWFDIDLLADDQLRQLDYFDEELNLGVLLGDGLGIQFFACEQSCAKVGRLHCCSENIMQISERWLGEQFLSHLRLLEDLLEHFRGWLPIFVTHISIFSNLIMTNTNHAYI